MTKTQEPSPADRRRKSHKIYFLLINIKIKYRENDIPTLSTYYTFLPLLPARPAAKTVINPGRNKTRKSQWLALPNGPAAVDVSTQSAWGGRSGRD
jgi:hypothetical protein